MPNFFSEMITKMKKDDPNCKQITNHEETAKKPGQVRFRNQGSP